MEVRTDFLKPLDNISSLIECSAISCNGELKSELVRLCSSIRDRRDGYTSDLVQASLPELERALSTYRSGRYDEGASDLIRVSRRWWHAVWAKHAA